MRCSKCGRLGAKACPSSRPEGKGLPLCRDCHELFCPHRSAALIVDTPESAAAKAKQARDVGRLFESVLGGRGP